MIKKFVVGDICGNLRPGDHVIFSLNAEGHHPEGYGYGFVNHVFEHCPAFKDVSGANVGDVITHHDEEYDIFFHGIVNHTTEHGWDYQDEHYNSYDAILEGLDELYEKYDDSLTRSMRSLWLGRGKMRSVNSEAKGNINYNIQAMANSKADLAVYVLDGYDE